MPRVRANEEGDEAQTEGGGADEIETFPSLARDRLLQDEVAPHGCRRMPMGTLM